MPPFLPRSDSGRGRQNHLSFTLQHVLKASGGWDGNSDVRRWKRIKSAGSGESGGKSSSRMREGQQASRVYYAFCRAKETFKLGDAESTWNRNKTAFLMYFLSILNAFSLKWIKIFKLPIMCMVNLGEVFYSSSFRSSLFHCRLFFPYKPSIATKKNISDYISVNFPYLNPDIGAMMRGSGTLDDSFYCLACVPSFHSDYNLKVRYEKRR